MDRKNFLKVLPIGLLGLVAAAKKQGEPEVSKAEHVTLHTDNGEYNLLAVPADSTEYRTIKAPAVRLGGSRR